MMAASHFRFHTRYELPAPPERVWNELIDVESWPTRWKYIRSARIRGIDKTVCRGAVIDCRVRGVVPYTFAFAAEIVRLVPYRELEVRSTGDLAGSGLWRLEGSNGASISEFIWEVSARSAFIRAIGALPMGRRFLEYSHAAVMDAGRRSFMRMLARK